MQHLLPLQLLTIGLGLAWLVRHREKSAAKGKSSAEADESQDGAQDADMERSATQWLARSGVNPHSSVHSITPHSDNATVHTSTYADVELLADGDIVYLRSESNVLTALVPIGRRLTLQPLQLAKGKPDAVPTAPLEQTSAWMVRRSQQQVVFELHGPHDRRHVLEADPGSPHGVALGGGSTNKRGRWLITSQGLVSARWPEHVFPLQVVPVQLLDARAMGRVKAGLAKKLAELSAKLEEAARERNHAEALVEQLGAELRVTRDEATTQIAELRAQLDAAIRARHGAERDMAALQNQRADEAMRTKMAQGRATQLDSELQQSQATVRRQEQQIQGMLAGHAEELRTLQQELQIAREANEGLKRAMGEQVMSLQGALELRDARILELEEENDRMDTVLQVIQTQLGGGALGIPEDSIGDGGDTPLDSLGEPEAAEESRGAWPLGEGPAVGAVYESADVQSLSEILRQSQSRPQLQQPPAAVPSADEPPLWRSLLDLTGGLSLTALKESLAISRRNTADDANGTTASSTPVAGDLEPRPAADPSAPTLTPSQPAESLSQPTPPPPVPALKIPATSNTAADAAGSAEHGFDAGSSGGAKEGVMACVVAGGWGSGGGSSATDEAEGEFVSAAALMSGNLQRLQSSSNGTATPTTRSEDLQQPQPGCQPPTQPPTAVVTLSRQQLDQVSGSGERAAQVEAGRCGAGAEAAARLDGAGGHTCSIGAPTHSATHAASRIPSYGITADAAAAGGGPSLPPFALPTPRGHTPSQLEYGMEATLTLDSLRRRMRQLEAERDRLELLRASLEESLPWRAVVSAGGAASAAWAWTGDAGLPGGGSGDDAGGGGGGGGFSTQAGPWCGVGGAAFQGGEAVAGRSGGGVGPQSRVPGVSVGAMVRMLSERVEVNGPAALQKWQAQEQQKPDRPGFKASTSSRRATGEVSEGGEAQGARGQSEGSAASALRDRQEDGRDGAAVAVATCSGQLRDVTRLLPLLPVAVALPKAAEVAAAESSQGGASSSGHSHATATTDGEAEAEGAGGSRFSSSGGASAASRILLEEAASGPLAVGACPVEVAATTPVEAEGDRGAEGGDSVGAPLGLCGGSSGLDAGATCSSSPEAAPADELLAGPGRRLPELLIGHRQPQPDESYSLYDSIDGMCNLGSTRALPSFRGLSSGAMTARRVGHSRQPSCGVAGELGPAEAPTAAAIVFSPLRPLRPPQAAPSTAEPGTPLTAAAAVAAGGVTTPKSLASTPGAGGDFFGQDDDAAVHCDDQEPSPPPAMLLGPLDQLRGAAAAGGAAGPGCGARIGGWALATLEKDDDDE